MENENMEFLTKTVFPSEERTIAVEKDDMGGAYKYKFVNCIGFQDGTTKYDDSIQTIQFVRKKPDGTMIPGIQTEQLLIALIDRHRKLNQAFPCAENALLIDSLIEAKAACEMRVHNRMDRGVMGELKE